MRVLIVDDDSRLSSLLEQGMREEGSEVTVAATGPDGLAAAKNGDFQVIVLDVMLPGLDGLEVARKLRRSGNRTPIVMLTAKDSEADTIDGLNLGADDYVTKPFSFDVLMARLRAVVRRGPAWTPTVVTIGDLMIDGDRHTAMRAGRTLTLTVREFRLLELLVRCSPRVVPRQTILEQVWGFDSEVSENNLEAFVSQLRSKVDAWEPKLIRTIRGVGYCVRLEGNA